MITTVSNKYAKLYEIDIMIGLKVVTESRNDANIEKKEKTKTVVTKFTNQYEIGKDTFPFQYLIKKLS